DSRLGGAHVVHVNVAHALGVEGSPDDHEWHAGLDQPVDELVANLPGLYKDAVQRSLPRYPGENLLLILFGRDEEQAQCVVMLVARLGDTLSEMREVRVGKEGANTAGQNQADHPGTLRGEGAGGGVGVVAGPPDHLPDSLAHLLAHVGVLVQHTRNGRAGNPRHSSNIFECEVQHGFARFAGSALKCQFHSKPTLTWESIG